MAVAGGEEGEELEPPPPPPPRSKEPPPPPPPRSKEPPPPPPRQSTWAEGGGELDLESTNATIATAAIIARKDEPIALSIPTSWAEVITNDNTESANLKSEISQTQPALVQPPGSEWRGADKKGTGLEGSRGLPKLAHLASSSSLPTVRNEAWVRLLFSLRQRLPVAFVFPMLPHSTMPHLSTQAERSRHPVTSMPSINPVLALWPPSSSCCLAHVTFSESASSLF